MYLLIYLIVYFYPNLIGITLINRLEKKKKNVFGKIILKEVSKEKNLHNKDLDIKIIKVQMF